MKDSAPAAFSNQTEALALEGSRTIWNKRDVISVLLLASAWLAVELFINPTGNFPLNDDWAYAYSVKKLLHNGVFVLSDWTATNLFSQVFWGALFCLPFGFSHTALRLSTLVLALIGLIASYCLLRESRAPRGLCLMATLLLALNPIFLSLSNTFMNDVPFLSFAVVASVLSIRALRSDSLVAYLFAILALCIAVLARQTGLAIALAFACTCLVQNGLSKKSILKAGIPVAVVGLIQIAYPRWLRMIAGESYFLGDQINTIFSELSAGFIHMISNYAQIVIYALVYLGLFLAPLLVLVVQQMLAQSSPRERKAIIFIPILTMLLLMPLLVLKHKLMPFIGNIFVDFGIGPVGQENTYQTRAPQIFWYIVTCIGLLGAAVIGECFVLAIRRVIFRRGQSGYLKSYAAPFALFSLLFLFLPLGALGLSWRGVYDRYLIPLLPYLLFVVLTCTETPVSTRLRSKSVLAAVLLLILYGGLAIGGTHDYLLSNRIVWQGINQLMEDRHIAPDRIRGGFEFYGSYLCKDRNRTSTRKEIAFACLWGNDKADYVLSFLPMNGYQEIKRYPFQMWLPPGQATVYILQKDEIAFH
jgi:hypothetical protein